MMIFFGLLIIALILYLLSRQKKAHSKQNEKKVDLYAVKSHTTGNLTQITFEINQEELIKRAKNGTLNLNNSKNEITTTDITGFYGYDEYSPNKKYCVHFCDGHFENDKWENGNIALLKGSTILFRKKIQRPNDCHVSNDGTVLCCDWLNSDELTGKFLIFDASGQMLYSKKTKANLGTCSISDDSSLALFETHNSDTNDGNKIFIIDILLKSISNKIERPFSFNKASIDTFNNIIKLENHRGIIYEINWSQYVSLSYAL